MFRRGILLLPILAASCSLFAGADVAEGDSHFRIGKYQPALKAYESAWETGDHSDELSDKIEETRYRVVADYARTLIQENDAHRSLEILDSAERMRPGHPQTTELRHRANAELSRDAVVRGVGFMQDENAEAGFAAFQEALAFDPSNEKAQLGYALSKERVDANRRRGESFFLTGLRDLGEGNEIRALAAFDAAEDLWGGNSRAKRFLEEIRQTLSDRSRREADEYLRAGLTGPAWMALNDANRLTPGVPEIEEAVRAIEAQLEANRAIGKAEGAIRAGELTHAEEQLILAGQVGGPQRAEEIRDVRASLIERRNRDRYILARALELDQQLVRSAQLYQLILADMGPRDQDVQIRLNRVISRLRRAQVVYAEALAAEAAGNEALYRAKLAETIRLARDFEDALDRIARLD